MMKYPEEAADARKSDGIQWIYTREQVGQMTGFAAKHAGDLANKNMAALGIDYVTFEGERMPYKSMLHGEHYRLIVEAMRDAEADRDGSYFGRVTGELTDA